MKSVGAELYGVELHSGFAVLRLINNGCFVEVFQLPRIRFSVLKVPEARCVQSHARVSDMDSFSHRLRLITRLSARLSAPPKKPVFQTCFF
jgi:hypothetical protein